MLCCIVLSRRDDPDFGIGGAVVVDDPVVAQRSVECDHVAHAGGIAAADHLLGNVVTALAHPRCDAHDSQFRRGKPEEKQRNEVPHRVSLIDELHIGARGERRLEGEVLAGDQQVVHALQHQPPRVDSDAFGVERREALGDFVGIDEFAAVEHLRQHCIGSRCLTGAVASRYDVEFRHVWHYRRGKYNH